MPPESIAALYDVHAPALYRFLLSLTGSEADTRDLLQDLFVKLVRQPATVLTDPQAWLFRAARNGFIDLVRRNAHRRGVLGRYEADLESGSHYDPAPPATPDPTLAIAHALAGLSCKIGGTGSICPLSHADGYPRPTDQLHHQP
ncbi:MAG: RNA polymerase sigma factor [Verrucomicrobiota bacterium]